MRCRRSIVGLGAIALALGASFSLAQAGGAAVVLLAVASIGASSMIARRELRGVHPIVVTALLLGGAAALLLFLASLALEHGQPVQWNRSAIGVAGLSGGRGRRPGLCHLLLAAAAAGGVPGWDVQWIEPLVAILESALFLRAGLVVQHDRRIPGCFGLPAVGGARTSRR